MVNTKQAVFYLEDEVYGMDIMDVKTIEKPIVVEQIANAPKNMKGIIRLRGDVIPVYSLRSKFGLPAKQPDQDVRLLITNSNGIQIAYEVDKMQGIANTDLEQMIEVPSIMKSKNTTYMKNIFNLDGRLIVLLDKDGILTKEEEEQLKKLPKSR